MVVGCHIFVEHAGTTPSPTHEMPVSHRCTGPARPTKLILAQVASHVIAALVLLDSGPTEWTERDIGLILLHPAL